MNPQRGESHILKGGKARWGKVDLLNFPWLFCEGLTPLERAVCSCDSHLYAITVVTVSSKFWGYMYSHNGYLRNEEEAGAFWG